jgi:hypothetical protein
MKNVLVSVMAAFVVALGALTLGCADDRPVYMDDGNGTGGHGNNAGSGGSGASSSGGNGTGGSHSNLPGADKANVWQVFSFDINEGDAYNTMEFYDAMGIKLIDCAESTSCMEDALNDTEGRSFQFLKQGSYSETYQGLLKGFCIYRNGTCGGQISLEAGNNCEDSDGDSRECLVAGVIRLSEAAEGSPEGELPATHTINVGFEDGDECKPVVFCFGSEHGITFLD